MSEKILWESTKFPFSSTAPIRSASPSVAKPISQRFEQTVSMSNCRFFSIGSGFTPPKEGYPEMGISSTYFRQALTFGLKESDAQLGRGGLAKHALSRMGKMFAYYGIRLESPFFNKKIANILTRIPYADGDYGIIKPQIDNFILGPDGQKILGSLEGVSKEKFQDGSGISRVFKKYTQENLIGMFQKIYGVNKTSYIKSR